MKIHLLLTALLLSLALPVPGANPPGILNHQGRIAVNGVNHDGTGYFKFALVDGAGTTTLWSNDGTSTGGAPPEDAVAVAIAKGHYAVLLGDTAVPHMTTAIPASVFTDHPAVALRIWFATASSGPFELLSPDRRIAATGYSLAAQRAESVAPGGVTGAMLANGAVTGTSLARGAVASAAISDGSVTAADLALGATGLVKKPVLLAEVGGGPPPPIPADGPDFPSPIGIPEEIDIISNSSWKSSTTAPAGWQNVGFDDTGWIAPVPLPAYPHPPEVFIPGTLAQHVWFPGGPLTAYFRKSFTLSGAIEDSQAVIRVDDAYDFYVNGVLVGSKPTELPADAQTYDITAHLQQGENVFAVKAWDLITSERAFLFDADVNYSPVPANAASVFVTDGKAYHVNAGSGAGNLKILDVSDPARPLALVELASPHPVFALAGARDVFVTTPTAYLAAADDSALNIIDVSNPASPQLLALLRDGLGGFDRLGGAWSVFVSGNTAYVAAPRDNAVTIIDVSNPALPVKLAEIVDEQGGFTKLGGAGDIFVSGNTAYVTAAGDHSLTVIDVSNPAAPVLLAEITDGAGAFTRLAGAREVFVLDQVAYVTAATDDALTIIDVGTPAVPGLLAEVVDGAGGFNRLDGAAGIFVSGSVAMVTAESDDAVTMVDVADPAHPAMLEETADEAGGFTRLDGADGIFISGTVGLVASNEDDALTILDLASPTAPYAGTVTNDALAANAVTSDKIEDGTVGTADLGDGSVNSDKIVDGSIGATDLGMDAVDSGIIVDGSVQATDLGIGAVTTSSISDDSVTSSKILDETIVGADLHADAVTSDKIADASIANADLSDGSVDSSKIADGSLDAADFAESAVTTSALADNSVTTGKILDGTILAGDLADGAVTGSKIADGSIAAADLGAAVVTTAALADTSVTMEKLNLGGGAGQMLYHTGTAIEWKDPSAVLGDESSTNEIQEMSREGNVLSLSLGGGSVDLGDADADPANELQTLSLDGNSLSLIPGGGSPVDLSQYFRSDGSQPFGGALDLNSHGILNVQSITPPPDPVVPAGPGTLVLGGNLDLGNHNIAVHSLTPSDPGISPLEMIGNLKFFNGNLDLNGNEIRNTRKLGIGIVDPLGALHVSTSASDGPPISLLEHSVSGTSEQLASVARLRVATTNPMVDGFGAGLAFESKGLTAGPFTVARIGAARDGADELGALHFQTVSTIPEGLTTKMTVRAGGNVEMLRDLYIGNISSSGDDTIYFDRNASEYLRWQDSQTRFMFSDDVWGTTFNPTSDRNLKEDFEKIDPVEVLEQVVAMPVTTWKFKEDDPALRHIGPMAQDFHRIFGFGADDRHIATTDSDGVALAAIQGLKRLLDDQERKIRDLEKRLEKLERSNRGNR